ncbi:hypothetical protein [Kaistia algarum]|uniref:hypothetical protein n=1 Tax=Kaistia algarum TaxID=2083279 RepID=UPI00225183CF|nr:hypothetical protein [Kaistia algarum]MCX5513878.1 hypothetical protein [Kaistia algarum]
MTVQRGIERPEGGGGKRQSPATPHSPRKNDAVRGTLRKVDAHSAPLPLDDTARARFQRAGGLSLDVDGRECLRGLSREESVEYVELHRRGLDNDDASFLRYILLGDRHVVATAKGGG